MQRLKIFCANVLWFLYTIPSAWKLKRAIKNTPEVQEKYLLDILHQNAGTEFGIEHNFKNIDSVASFQKNVPLRSYDDFYPYIERIELGIPDVLTKEAVTRFGVSSGSTNASKLIPYTSALLNEFRNGVNAWFYHLVKRFPKILYGKTYWSVTPIRERIKYSKGGVPIGFDDESEYVGTFAQWIIRTLHAQPAELAHITDHDAWNYVTLRFLVESKTLSWISIWNPTFLTLCLSNLEQDMERIVHDIEQGTISAHIPASIEKSLLKKVRKNITRAEELKTLLAEWNGKSFHSINSSGKTFYEVIWGKLECISCWTDGEASTALPQLKKFFPTVPIQPKGLLATEAFISLPLERDDAMLLCNSHFFEFEEYNALKEGEVKLAHELAVGKYYWVIVTTGGGLYRYRMGDIVLVIGFQDSCPMIRFTGKGDKVVDIYGEKMNAQFVRTVAEETFRSVSIQPIFWMIAPEQSGSGKIQYSLFVKLDDSKSGEETCKNVFVIMEKKLRENYHYNYCRELHQLEELKLFLVDKECDTLQVYMDTCVKLGQRLGDIKPTVLHSFRHWSEKFQGKFIE